MKKKKSMQLKIILWSLSFLLHPLYSESLIQSNPAIRYGSCIRNEGTDFPNSIKLLMIERTVFFITYPRK